MGTCYISLKFYLGISSVSNLKEKMRKKIKKKIKKRIKNKNIITGKLNDHLFSDVIQADKDRAVEEIIESSSPRKSFFVMIAVSAVLATMGIIENNAAVIIGGMLVAPMLSPILAIALGVEMADYRLLKRSFRVVVLAVIYAIAFSWIFALVLNQGRVDVENLNHEMTLRVGINLSTILIALVAGFGASLSLIRSELAKFMSGVAIAVALIPPLSMSAIGISILNFNIFYNAFASFCINLVGIVLASLVVFSLVRLSDAKKELEEELKEEEELLGK
jgi:uncharacterized hydrophobic protein (TIGR00271 family)